MHIPGNINKPFILSNDEDIKHIVPGTPFRDIFKHLKRDKDICITGTYGFAMAFYAWLKKQVSASFPSDDYTGWRRQRNALHRHQSHVWIRIEDHRPELDRAPGNPWLQEFFPDKNHFLITFADYLGLNGAKQWYEKGVHYPVLDFPLHPFYGVYFPSRHDHLLLFDRWLAEQKSLTRGIDIGTGSGILAFMMLNHGIQQVFATDINPNSIFSVRNDIQNIESYLKGSLHLEQNHFLGTFEPEQGDLIVFNPPWIPETPEKTLDRASYYEPAFFQDLFSELREKCPKGTIIALMFSSFARLAGLLSKNPIEEALNNYKEDFQLTGLYKQKVGQKTSKKKSWLQEIRSKEEVELYILKRT
jgi:hypothetical protein